MTKQVKGYKATLWNGMPKYGRRRTPYSVGRTYSTKAELVLCQSGLHFCRRLCNVYGTYDSAFYTRVFEVEARGRLCSDVYKSCTDRLKFVKELTPEEILMKLAGDANDMHTDVLARNKAVNILLSIISMDSEIKDLNTNIVEAPRERNNMPALYHVSRRLQWAQAFVAYGELPICSGARHYCGITKRELGKLVETLRQDPVLKTEDKERQ